MSKRILVTGCAGLIGNNFCRYLLGKGHKVVGIDDLSGGYYEFLPHDENGNMSFYRRNLSDKISDIFEKHGINTVYHFAAYAAEGLSPFIRKFNYYNNVLCSMNVINNCIEYDAKLIFTSSIAVYGNNKPPFYECETPRPIDPYGIAKYAVELDIKQAADQFGLKYNIVRPHNVVGKYQNIWDKYRNVLGIFIRQAYSELPLTVFGNGNQRRAFSDVKYCMEPLYKLAMNKYNGKTYNLGSDNSYTINELVKMIRFVTHKDINIKYLPQRHEAEHVYCSHALAKRDLGFNDQTDLIVCIKEMCDFYKDKIDRYNVKDLSSRYEVRKRIYDCWK